MYKSDKKATWGRDNKVGQNSVASHPYGREKRMIQKSEQLNYEEANLASVVRGHGCG
jgi:hypothetical protein